MSDDQARDLSRREFVQGTVSGLALAAAPAAVLAAASAKDADKAAVLAQIPKMHAENVTRLQEWIALPSIAAENRNYPQGPEYMAKLARDAGFTGVKLIPTSGKPGVFGKIDAGARTTMAIYFMYDVKQFVPEEWSSPPLEARLVQKAGLGTVCMGRGAVLVEQDGHTPAVAGFFDKVKPLTTAQEQMIREHAAKTAEAGVKQALGVQHWIRDKNWLDSCSPTRP